jgi:UDP-GlcNAc:undecaprenyl-phosphate GlcNAc-1-phosphate transferase
LALILALRPIAIRLGLVDLPDARKRHERPTLAIGGVAMFVVIGLMGVAWQPRSPQLIGFDLSALVLVTAGVIDDLHRLRWRWRMGAQIASALILIHVADIRVQDLGHVIGPNVKLNGLWAEALTVISVVGVINAVNMRDGVDGLAGSLALAAILMLAGVATYAGNLRLAQDLVIVAGALVGFLVFNLRSPWSRRALIFLGNAGAELLGLIIAAACFRLTQNPLHPIGPKLAPFFLAPALIDCLTLMVRRVRRGESPFMADRDHFHHLLLDAGVPATGVVVIVFALTIAIGGLAILAAKAHVAGPWFTLAFLFLWLGYGIATRSRDDVVAFVRGWSQRLGLLKPVPTLQAEVSAHPPASIPKSRRVAAE